jgi:zinc D-Ala-D-Ala dipeptidase
MNKLICIKKLVRLLVKSIALAIPLILLLSSCSSEPESQIAKGSSESAASVSSSSIDTQLEIDPNSPLTCGEFVWLWMKELDGNNYNNIIAQAMKEAQQQGYISSDINSKKTLTIQDTAYLLSFDIQGDSKINSAHYDWQIADLDSADNSFKKYLLMAYAQGILTADNGNIHPKSSIFLNDATSIITRLTDKSKRRLPPDRAAPYFEYQGLVEVNHLDPTIGIDLKYATKDNFTGVAHYTRSLCLLEADSAKKLIKANEYFHKRGYSIKIWDGYRPVSVQWSLYYAAPANLKQYAPAPSKYSQHSKGIAADITLVDKNGNEMEMPTKFDSFSEKAHADYSNLPKQVIENRNYLIKGMEQQGFVVNSLEWWHYYLPGKTSLQISKVDLDEFVEKRNEFYQTTIQNFYSNS